MKRLQGFICGFLAAIVLLISLPALAETMQATFNVINIKINGESEVKAGENFTLSNGNKVPYTIVYNGTTYLPLRETVRLVGKELVFDGATSTADIIDKPKEQQPIELPKTEGKTMSEQQYATRSELARFLVQSLDLNDNGAEVEFSDVPTTHEYYEDIKIVFQQRIMLYSVPTNFEPDSLVNRHQYAVYLARALKLNIEEEAPNIKIKDIMSFAHGSQNFIKKLVSLGLMELDENGNFNPNDYITSPLIPNPDLKNYIQK